MRTKRAIWAVLPTVALLGLGAPDLAWAQSDSTNAAAPSVAAPATHAQLLPFGASEVVKMHQGGLGPDVITGYVNNTQSPFRLNADNIIYLHQIGVPQEVITAMIQRDGQLQRESAAAQQAAPAYAPVAAAPAPAPMIVPATPAPVVTYAAPQVYPVYPDYGYGYPAYGYAYPDYGPTIVVGGPWWGWGWGGGGFRHGGFRGGFHGGFRGGVGVGIGFNHAGGGRFHR